MRHLRSIIYALVLAPAVWILCGVGFDQDLTGRAQSVFGVLPLLLAGVAYAILLFSPISPAGPLLAGLIFAACGVWARTTPSAYADIWPSSVTKDGFDVSTPGYGLAVLLAVPLIATALSARRWAGFEPPQIVLIGTIGRARGSAAVAGTPMAAERTAVIPQQRQAPSPAFDDIGDIGDEKTTVMQLGRAGGRFENEPTQAAGDAEDATQAMSRADAPTGSDPLETAREVDSDEATRDLASDEATRDLASDEVTHDVGADLKTRDVGGDAVTTDLAGDTATRDVGPDLDTRDVGTDLETRDVGGDAVTTDLAGDTVTRDVGDDAVTSDLAGDTVTRDVGDDAVTTDLAGDTVTRDLAAEETTSDLAAAGATREIAEDDAGATTRIVDPHPETTQDDGERTQLLRLPTASDGERTQVLRPTGNGEQTQVIRTGTVEPPGDRTQLLTFPAPGEATAVIQQSQDDTEAPSIVGEERPDPGADPTTRLSAITTPPGEATTRPTKNRRATVTSLERPADEAEDDTRRLTLPTQRKPVDDDITRRLS